MPDSATGGQFTPSQHSLIPPERAFQLDPNGLGGIAQSVNLFRGDMAVPVTVFSVKGRSGATVDLVLTYASNIGLQANTWNLEAPTGPPGSRLVIRIRTDRARPDAVRAADGRNLLSDRQRRVQLVVTVDSGGTAVDRYTYDKDGAATSAQRLGLDPIVYDEATGMSSSIAIAATQRTLRFAYTAGKEWAVKLLRDSAGQEMAAQLCVRGNDGVPLFEARRMSGAAGNSQYVRGPDGLTAYLFGGVRYRLVDEAGQVVASFDYGPFGITIRQGGTRPDIILYRYTGQELDGETGLYNYRARFYDPVLGRFVDIDPAGTRTTPYGYVLNDPINLTDPTGEFPWLAFLIVVVISAIVGAVAGAVTYAVSHQGDFSWAKFFEYALVGAVAGAVGGTTAFFGGVLATGALAAAGVSTSTSIASGVVVGAVSGAADGAVSGTLNQLGANLIEGRPLGQGLGNAALMGAGIGALTGGAMGLATGVGNKIAGVPDFDRPSLVVGHLGDPPFTPNREVAAKLFSEGRARLPLITSAEVTQNNGTLVGTGLQTGRILSRSPENVIAVAGHGPSSQSALFWRAADAVGEQTQTFAHRLQMAATNQGVQISRIDLISCSGGVNGSARALARSLNVPARAGTDVMTVTGDGKVFIAWWRSLFRPGSIRTYYPGQLRTSWNYLFGY